MAESRCKNTSHAANLAHRTALRRTILSGTVRHFLTEWKPPRLDAIEHQRMTSTGLKNYQHY